MKGYEVKALEPVKAVDLPKLDPSTRGRIQKKIDQIKKDPHGYGKPLGRELVGLYKARVGKYRIVYQVRESGTEIALRLLSLYPQSARGVEGSAI